MAGKAGLFRRGGKACPAAQAELPRARRAVTDYVVGFANGYFHYSLQIYRYGIEFALRLRG
jgi:hypothetical protein